MLSFLLLPHLRRFFAYALAIVTLFMVDPHAYTLRLDVWKHAPHQLLVGYFRNGASIMISRTT
jgi:hypothetical protein